MGGDKTDGGKRCRGRTLVKRYSAFLGGLNILGANGTPAERQDFTVEERAIRGHHWFSPVESIIFLSNFEQ